MNRKMKNVFLGAVIGFSFLVSAGNLLAQTAKDPEDVALANIQKLLPEVYKKLDSIYKSSGSVQSFTLSDGKLTTSMTRDPENAKGYAGEMSRYLWSISETKTGLEARRDEDYYLYVEKDEQGYRFEGPIPYTEFEEFLGTLNQMKPTQAVQK